VGTSRQANRVRASGGEQDRRMDEPGHERLTREETSWRRATILELFFDLVFVFALDQVSLRLLKDFHSGGSGSVSSPRHFRCFWGSG
jgi:Bacterial low temperature requirement A protein (LtrA)